MRYLVFGEGVRDNLWQEIDLDAPIPSYNPPTFSTISLGPSPLGAVTPLVRLFSAESTITFPTQYIAPSTTAAEFIISPQTNGSAIPPQAIPLSVTQPLPPIPNSFGPNGSISTVDQGLGDVRDSPLNKDSQQPFSSAIGTKALPATSLGTSGPAAGFVGVPNKGNCQNLIQNASGEVQKTARPEILESVATSPNLASKIGASPSLPPSVVRVEPYSSIDNVSPQGLQQGPSTSVESIRPSEKRPSPVQSVTQDAQSKALQSIVARVSSEKRRSATRGVLPSLPLKTSIAPERSEHVPSPQPDDPTQTASDSGHVSSRQEAQTGNTSTGATPPPEVGKVNPTPDGTALPPTSEFQPSRASRDVFPAVSSSDVSDVARKNDAVKFSLSNITICAANPTGTASDPNKDTHVLPASHLPAPTPTSGDHLSPVRNLGGRDELMLGSNGMATKNARDQSVSEATGGIEMVGTSEPAVAVTMSAAPMTAGESGRYEPVSVLGASAPSAEGANVNEIAPVPNLSNNDRGSTLPQAPSSSLMEPGLFTESDQMPGRGPHLVNELGRFLKQFVRVAASLNNPKNLKPMYRGMEAKERRKMFLGVLLQNYGEQPGTTDSKVKVDRKIASSPKKPSTSSGSGAKERDVNKNPVVLPDGHFAKKARMGTPKRERTSQISSLKLHRENIHQERTRRSIPEREGNARMQESRSQIMKVLKAFPTRLLGWGSSMKNGSDTSEAVIHGAKRVCSNLNSLEKMVTEEDISTADLGRYLLDLHSSTHVLAHLWEAIRSNLESNKKSKKDETSFCENHLGGITDLLTWADTIVIWVSERYKTELDGSPGDTAKVLEIEKIVLDFLDTGGFKGSKPEDYLMGFVRKLSAELGKSQLRMLGEDVKSACENLESTMTHLTKSVAELSQCADSSVEKRAKSVIPVNSVKGGSTEREQVDLESGKDSKTMTGWNLALDGVGVMDIPIPRRKVDLNNDSRKRAEGLGQKESGVVFQKGTSSPSKPSTFSDSKASVIRRKKPDAYSSPNLAMRYDVEKGAGRGGNDCAHPSGEQASKARTEPSCRRDSAHADINPSITPNSRDTNLSDADVMMSSDKISTPRNDPNQRTSLTSDIRHVSDGGAKGTDEVSDVDRSTTVIDEEKGRKEIDQSHINELTSRDAGGTSEEFGNREGGIFSDEAVTTKQSVTGVTKEGSEDIRGILKTGTGQSKKYTGKRISFSEERLQSAPAAVSHEENVTLFHDGYDLLGETNPIQTDALKERVDHLTRGSLFAIFALFGHVAETMKRQSRGTALPMVDGLRLAYPSSVLRNLESILAVTLPTYPNTGPGTAGPPATERISPRMSAPPSFQGTFTGLRSVPDPEIRHHPQSRGTGLRSVPVRPYIDPKSSDSENLP